MTDCCQKNVNPSLCKVSHKTVGIERLKKSKNLTHGSAKLNDDLL